MNVIYTMLRHDRIVVLAALIAVVAIAWLYVLLGAGIEMDEMDMGGGQIMLMSPPWTPGYAALICLMWAVMMMAMMLPGAAPVILLIATLGRERSSGGGAPAAGLFALGYAMIWIGFSLVATLLQWGLDRAEKLSDTMAFHSAAAAGVVLIAAGIYQWSPLKRTCLWHCRSPLAFLLHHWRGGVRGAVVSGLRHGVYCLGCCWMLMALLFVGGVMNLTWIAVLALLVLIEKTLPWGGRVSLATGAALVVWGSVTLVNAI